VAEAFKAQGLPSQRNTGDLFDRSAGALSAGPFHHCGPQVGASKSRRAGTTQRAGSQPPKRPWLVAIFDPEEPHLSPLVEDSSSAPARSQPFAKTLTRNVCGALNGLPRRRPLLACAVRRRAFPVGANPTATAQPEAPEQLWRTKWLNLRISGLFLLHLSLGRSYPERSAPGKLAKNRSGSPHGKVLANPRRRV